jgi:hypothetical protein
MDDAMGSRNARLPIIIRPSRTLGGTGGAIAVTDEEYDCLAAAGLAASPISEILVEESIAAGSSSSGMRDRKDNVVIICSIENFDPMGVHTGDSITVAPAQTLTDKEYQLLRDASLAIIREIGVDTGGRTSSSPSIPRTPPGGDRDEPTRLAQLGARQQGHGLSDREDRGEARGRLHARRDPQRHHPRRRRASS